MDPAIEVSPPGELSAIPALLKSVMVVPTVDVISMAPFGPFAIMVSGLSETILILPPATASMFTDGFPLAELHDPEVGEPPAVKYRHFDASICVYRAYWK